VFFFFFFLKRGFLIVWVVNYQMIDLFICLTIDKYSNFIIGGANKIIKILITRNNKRIN